MTDTEPRYSMVVPTIGRPSLFVLLRAIEASSGPAPDRIVLVDDRRQPAPPLDVDRSAQGEIEIDVLRSDGRGPAAARNVGWRATRTPWVVFLDDDVEVTSTWRADLISDLAMADADVGAIQGRITVPLPADRRPTDWERGTAGLATARWITADIAYRRAALEAVAGFDERFRTAFREDADLALRVQGQGWKLQDGRRRTIHPVRPARWNASVRQQRGNADDVLMRRMHGADWHARAEAPVGRRPMHLLTVTAAALGLAGLAARRQRIAAIALGAWAALTGEFAVARILPGPRDRSEVARMAATSVLIPPMAVAHWLRGQWIFRASRSSTSAPGAPIGAVLVDRDGTLVYDVPYNCDPEAVREIDGVRDALTQLRDAGVKIGVVTNQSGVARGLIRPDQLEAVNRRIDELLGPFDTWQICPHDGPDGCDCRKPQPGLVIAAARELDVPPERCALIGDTGADVAAGLAAGVACAVLVPNDATRSEEIESAPMRAESFADAVEQLLAGSSA